MRRNFLSALQQFEKYDETVQSNHIRFTFLEAQRGIKDAATVEIVGA